MAELHLAGWKCPICGRVYAPWVPECTYHGPGYTNVDIPKSDTPVRDFMTHPQVNTDQFMIDYTHKESRTNTSPQYNTGDGKFYDHLTK